MIVRGKSHAAIACVVLASLVSGAVSGARWQQILDEEVTPRFPDGIEAIRTAARVRAGAQFALRVSHAVDVSF